MTIQTNCELYIEIVDLPLHLVYNDYDDASTMNSTVQDQEDDDDDSTVTFATCSDEDVNEDWLCIFDDDSLDLANSRRKPIGTRRIPNCDNDDDDSLVLARHRGMPMFYDNRSTLDDSVGQIMVGDIIELPLNDEVENSALQVADEEMDEIELPLTGLSDHSKSGQATRRLHRTFRSQGRR